MELNNYQRQVMRDLSAYLNCVNESANLHSAWRKYWFDKDVAVGLGGVPRYNDSIEAVPHICMKVPTGGGKTFMACASVKRIFNAMPTGKPQVVVWLVPSDSILSQTIRTLSDVNHPYRQRLDQDFAGRVGVYTKEMLLNGQNFSPDTVREMLTICIMSYSFHVIKRDTSFIACDALQPCVAVCFPAVIYTEYFPVIIHIEKIDTVIENDPCI